ncbi:hypothetical protein GCM10022393_09560 [Aquimarina addita]|uniref:Lipocalin-like domain-containing protein n=1 Tax=Aquimarina addita TaxID=870485 RepID=A0ABP7XCN3_9FLAO
MKKLFLTSLVIVLSITTISCGDDDGGSVEETLTGGTWKLVSLEVNGNDVTATELDACDLEETYVFNNDNTFVFTSNRTDDSTDTCVESTVIGAWEVKPSNNTTEFIAAYDGDDITNEDDQLDFRIEDQTLVEIIEEPVASGGSDSYRYRYEKQ